MRHGRGGDNFLSAGAGAVGGVSIRGADGKRWNYGGEGFFFGDAGADTHFYICGTGVGSSFFFGSASVVGGLFVRSRHRQGPW